MDYIRKYSKKRQKIELQLKRIYTEMDYDSDKHCFFCNSYTNLTHCHLVRRSYNSQLIAVKENIVHACHDCHTVLDMGLIEEIKQLPNLDKYIEAIKALDYGYYRKFINKIDYEFTDNI